MFRKILSYIDYEDGAALIFAIIIFMVLVIITSSVVLVFSSNQRQALHQEESVRAYFVALSGVEIVKSALLMVDEGDGRTLIENIVVDGIVLPRQVLNIDGHTVYVDISHNEVDEELIIESSVTLSDSGVSSSLSLFMDVSADPITFPLLERWEK